MTEFPATRQKSNNVFNLSISKSQWKSIFENDNLELVQKYHHLFDIFQRIWLLISAGEQNCFKIVKFVLEYACNYDPFDEPLYILDDVVASWKSIEMIKLTIPNFENSRRLLFRSALYEGRFDVLKWLIEFENVDFMAAVDRNLPICICAERNSVDFISYLLEKGTPVNSRNWLQESCLFVAARRGDLKLTKFLVEKAKADVNLCNAAGFSPLYVSMKNQELFNYLIENGADVNLKTGSAFSPIKLAISSSNMDSLKFLISKGANLNVKQNGESLLYIAVRNQSKFPIIKYIVEHGIDITIKNDDGDNALCYCALWIEEFEVIKFLVEKGFPINMTNQSGESALYISSMKSHLKIVSYLIQSKADLNLRNQNGQTALYVACSWGFFPIVRILVENGALLDLVTKDNETALFIACFQGHFDIVKLLISKGADRNIRNKKDLSPFDIAMKHSKMDIVNYLSTLSKES